MGGVESCIEVYLFRHSDIKIDDYKNSRLNDSNASEPVLFIHKWRHKGGGTRVSSAPHTESSTQTWLRHAELFNAWKTIREVQKENTTLVQIRQPVPPRHPPPGFFCHPPADPWSLHVAPWPSCSLGKAPTQRHSSTCAWSLYPWRDYGQSRILVG